MFNDIDTRRNPKIVNDMKIRRCIESQARYFDIDVNIFAVKGFLYLCLTAIPFWESTEVIDEAFAAASLIDPTEMKALISFLFYSNTSPKSSSIVVSSLWQTYYDKCDINKNKQKKINTADPVRLERFYAKEKKRESRALSALCHTNRVRKRVESETVERDR